MRFLIFLLFSEVLFFASCTNKYSTVEEDAEQSVLVTPLREDFTTTPDSLTIDEYRDWLKEQRGITFDEKENEKFSLSILYKPLNLEAALSGGYTSQSELQKYIRTKQGFHYFLVECLDKNKSVTNVTNKEALFKELKENILFVKNSTDTIQNAILEIFPAQLMNQPHQLLVMVPAEGAFTDLQAIVLGKPFGLKDLKISVSQKLIKSFPEIKL